MKYSQWIGVICALSLIISGFTNWTWYPDIHKYFTGFVSEDNIYGKPAKVFIFIGCLSIVFFVIPKVWAKRWNLFVCGVTVAYAVKSFILFSGCYRGVCPDKQPGLWVMLFSSILMLVCSVLPDVKLGKSRFPQEGSLE